MRERTFIWQPRDDMQVMVDEIRGRHSEKSAPTFFENLRSTKKCAHQPVPIARMVSTRFYHAKFHLHRQQKIDLAGANFPWTCRPQLVQRSRCRNESSLLVSDRRRYRSIHRPLFRLRFFSGDAATVLVIHLLESIL